MEALENIAKVQYALSSNCTVLGHVSLNKHLPLPHEFEEDCALSRVLSIACVYCESHTVAAGTVQPLKGAVSPGCTVTSVCWGW